MRTFTLPPNAPKSYIPESERAQLHAELLREGAINAIYVEESSAAGDAGDEHAAWEWLALAEMPAACLMFFKQQHGAQFVRDYGFNTTRADAAYGPGWLDK